MPPTPTPSSPPATKDELLRRGRSVIKLSDSVLEELAAAWGVDVSASSRHKRPTALLVSPALGSQHERYDVRDEHGRLLMTVNTADYDLLYDMIAGWCARQLDESPPPVIPVGPLAIEPYNHNYRVIDIATRKTVALVSYGGEDVMGKAVAAFNRERQQTTSESARWRRWSITFWPRNRRRCGPLERRTKFVFALSPSAAVKEATALFGSSIDVTEVSERPSP